MEQTTRYFAQAGRHNTEATLEIVRQRAQAQGITQVVLASTHGYTAETARRILPPAVRVIAVTLSAAYSPEGWTMTPDERQRLEAQDITVLTCQHALSGDVNQSLSDNVPIKVIQQTLYTFGQGMKVAVEVALMAADAGLLDMQQEAIAVAGSSEGADTAIVITPAYCRHFSDLRIREILAKPR